MDLIYGGDQDEPKSFGFTEGYTTRATSGSGEATSSYIDNYDLDTFRFDVNPLKLDRYKSTTFKKMTKKKFVTGISKDKILQNIMDLSDSDGEAQDKEGNAIGKAQQEQIRKMEINSRKGTKDEKKRKRLENMGHKVESDSDENSEDIDGESGDEEKTGVKKKEDKKDEVKEHKPLLKSQDEIKKAQFLGEKYGHFKMGSYVRIELQVEKKFSRQLNPDYPVVLCSLKHQETGYAYLRVKIKKHRWYPHIMKNKDPITFSMGWRKF